MVKQRRTHQQDVCDELYVHGELVRRVAGGMAPEADLRHMAELFKAMGDATRVRILAALSISRLCVCDLADLLGMSSSAVSHQLRVLRAARIVSYRRDGKNVFYGLDDDHIAGLLLQAQEHVQEHVQRRSQKLPHSEG